MKTDDFLADLETQLQTARPRRDLRPIAGLAVVLVAVVAVLVLVPRPGHDEQPAAVAAVPRVLVLNGTTLPGLAGRTAQRLRTAGYRVLPVSNAPEQAQRISTVTALAPRWEPEARALRRLLDAAPESRDGWTGYAPLQTDAQIVVTLGSDQVPQVQRAAEIAACRLSTHPVEGRQHRLKTFTAADYDTNPPTSGDHTPQAAADGVSAHTPPLGELVHALEHGRIELQYRRGTDAGTVHRLAELVTPHVLLFENHTGMDAA
ncbi:MAG: hypothetical protein QOI80_2111, partial [Solirubrobacteraceae bacterium]|nr:hypothetical protein [Solirubrobacteraceae bacterium]